jgi:hypothetical protein
VLAECNPTKIEGNSSVFRFEIGQYPQILSHFEKNSEQVKSEVRHEQAYLSREIHKLGKLEYWQDEWQSFALQSTKALFKNSQLAPASLRCISQIDQRRFFNCA